jgi:hypothetical protein
LPTIAARSGDGTLDVDAGLIDFYGNLTLNGTDVSRFVSASDVRFIGRATSVDLPAPVGRVTQQLGWLHAAGDLEFSATQLYPATRTQFELSASKAAFGGGAEIGSIKVSGNGRAAGDVYSAAGKLSLDAATIVQNGVVKAPQGQIELNASQQLSLGAGSQTSVSGNDLTVLFGTTESGVQWRYADGAGATAAELDRVSANGKRIELRAPEVNVAPGATVDLRGGGDVLAVEFVPGNGGDADITLRDNTFAIIPKSSLTTSPYDSHLQVAAGSRDPGFGFSFANARDSVLYDSIDIGAGSAVSPGEYALLPARFALLPGAYLVQLETGASYRNLADGQRVALPNGNVAVAGHRVALGTSVRESQSVGVIVSPGSDLRRFSDYALSRSSLFAGAAARARAPAPAAPWDAGRLLIADAR